VKDENTKGDRVNKLEFHFEGISAIQLFYTGKEAKGYRHGISKNGSLTT
jgi:hypothetical protein